METPLSRAGRRGRRRGLGVAVAVLTVALAAACSSGAERISWRSPGEAATGRPGPVPAELAISPGANASGVSPADPVIVTLSGGALDAVAVASSSGKAVPGAFDPERHSWRSTEPLGYDKSYTVTVSGHGLDGKPIEGSSVFSTVHPRNVTQPYLQANAMSALSACTPCGVGTIITVHFDENIPNRDVAEKMIHVTTDPPVPVYAHWFNNQDVAVRPTQYWAPGTKVNVSVNAYGRDLGNGLFGEADASASFTIGQSKVAVADSNTHHMLVYLDGALARDIPISMGRGGYYTGSKGESIHFWTYSGTYTVLAKTPTTHMTSASYGITNKNDPLYYDEVISDTVQLSKDGIYGHLRDWPPMDALGGWNSSHGCINIGPDHAKWFYDTFGPGDVVKVLNTPIAISYGLSAGAAWDVVTDWRQL